jgi:tetratricopeptide (TPR) repeat protein
MKKILLTAVFISFVVVLAGCTEERFMTPKPAPDVFEQMTPSAAEEVAIAEELTAKRLAYLKEIEKLKSYYEQSGNELKLEWINRELKYVNALPRYSYIIQAEVAGDNLVAKDSIPRADVLYQDAKESYKSTNVFPLPGSRILTQDLIISRRRMLKTLNMCNDLIKEYPTSDKIDDAAYLAGEIHEFFKDYSIAVLYYKRAFQWDPQTPYPARYKAANLLDHQLFERDHALALYRESLQQEKEYLGNDTVTSIEQRIADLTVEPKSEKSN